VLHPAPTELHELIKTIKDDTKTTTDTMPNLNMIYAPPGDQPRAAESAAATSVAASV
jgi:hypothetical protein